jgi:arginine utilization protein RocB
MSKHTPGPWVLVGNSIKSRKADCIVVRLPAHTDCVGDESDQQIERWNADSNLIAAAPELLEALEDLVCLAERAMRESESGEWMVDEELRDARAAIAKARGE